MQGDPQNPNQTEETQVVFFKKNPQPASKDLFYSKLKRWLRVLAIILVLYYLVRVVEKGWFTLVISVATLVYFRWGKIMSEVDERMKEPHVFGLETTGRRAFNIISSVLLIKILTYTVGLIFLFFVLANLTCGIQESIHVNFLISKKDCEFNATSFNDWANDPLNKY